MKHKNVMQHKTSTIEGTWRRRLTSIEEGEEGHRCFKAPWGRDSVKQSILRKTAALAHESRGVGKCFLIITVNL